ncbi:hypothetical protein APY04_2273 [Hyphomicrobium sulfonivorans]|uniref:Uncharacterized protein n=1 Tax=Hyphomicrobium sulfonivorans TaxID=121290 RepID=A0A109BDQ3_HYPSL|nr:hypothetical protein APY04_2273 [Hyphomicrobium sulfonivorans]
MREKSPLSGGELVALIAAVSGIVAPDAASCAPERPVPVDGSATQPNRLDGVLGVAALAGAGVGKCWRCRRGDSSFRVCL